VHIVVNPPDQYLDELQRSLDAEPALGIADIRGTHPVYPPTYFVAIDNDKAAGVATLRPSSESCAELYKLYVAPTHRRLGIGMKLVNHVMDVLKSEGFSELDIEIIDQSLDFWKRVTEHRKCEPHYDGKCTIFLD